MELNGMGSGMYGIGIYSKQKNLLSCFLQLYTLTMEKKTKERQDGRWREGIHRRVAGESNSIHSLSLSLLALHLDGTIFFDSGVN